MPERGGIRWSARVGMVLVVVGIGLLGYAGWQFWGTNWVALRAQDHIRADLESRWSRGHASVRVDAGGELLSSSAVVRIPRFGADWVVPVVEGTSDAALSSGLAHDPRVAGVGEVGNYVLAGHRVTHGEPLRDMPDLVPGDRVIVETRDTVYTYVLDTGGSDLEVPLTASWVTAPMPVNPAGGVQPLQAEGSRLLTLVTCAELFHTDDRLVAFGHLESTATG